MRSLALVALVSGCITIDNPCPDSDSPLPMGEGAFEVVDAPYIELVGAEVQMDGDLITISYTNAEGQAVTVVYRMTTRIF